MFLGSTKDLKKGEALRPKGRKAASTNKKSTSISFKKSESEGIESSNDKHSVASISSTREIDVVAQAAHAREERARQRDLYAHAVKIEALVRGFLARKLANKSLRTTYDMKLKDLVKLSQILYSRGVELSPPPQVVLDLYGCLFTGLFCGTITKEMTREKKGQVIAEDIKRVMLFCKYVLNPSLTQKDPTKNCMHVLCPEISVGFNLRATRLVEGILFCLSNDAIKIASLNQEEVEHTLLKGVRLLFGKAPSEALRPAFGRLRQTLMERPLAKNTDTFFHFIRRLILTHADLLLRVAETSDSDGDVALVRHTSPLAEGVVTTAFEACLEFLIEEDLSSTCFERRQESFFKTLLACPLLTLLLSSPSKVSFANSVVFSQMLALCRRPFFQEVSDFTSIAGHAAAFEAGHWLQGNVFHLATSLRVTSSVSSNSGLDLVNEKEDNILCTYLDVCAEMMTMYHLPYLYHARATVLWTKRDKSNLLATGMPLCLQEQMKGIVQKQFLLDLYERILVPVREDAASYYGVGSKGKKRLADAAMEVQDSLKKDGKTIASAALAEEKAEKTWFTGKWAAKLVRKFNKAMGITADASSTSLTAPAQSSMEAAAAAAHAAKEAVGVTRINDGLYAALPEATYHENPSLIISLLRLWAYILPQIAQPASSKGGVSKAENRAGLAILRDVSVFIFQTRVVDRLWIVLLKYATGSQDLQNIAQSFASHVQSKQGSSEGILGIPISRTINRPAKAGAGHVSQELQIFACSLTAFASTLRICLTALNDEELYTFGRPLPLAQILGAVKAFKTALSAILLLDPMILSEPEVRPRSHTGAAQDAKEVSLNDARNAIPESLSHFSVQFWHFAARNMSAVMRDLHSMWSRRAFSRADLWTVEETSDNARLRAMLRSDFYTKNSVCRALLFNLPGAVSFHERMKLFRDIIDMERLEIQGDPNPNSGSARPSIVFQVRRATLLEDGIKAMEKIKDGRIKMRIQIQYINEFGEAEAGIDIGGLFKDFVTDLSDRIFDPNYGLFCLTNENLLYPNPAAPQLYDAEELSSLFSFLGRVLGKALYENITLQPQFAHFFLAFMHGRYNFQHMFSDLVTLDAELHKNLLFLKNYDGDVADLCLTFSVSDSTLGTSTERPLMPGGEKIDVTSINRHQYIHAVAKYYLHDRLKAQAGAFFHGLYQVLDRDLLGMFSPPELQILISGASTGIDADDLKKHCRYNGYTGLDRTITNFWAVFDAMSERDKALFIKFVTSCERPPCLGFASLDPPFTIQRGVADDSRLPTASTCFNVLKLPVYSNKQILQGKLLTAIRSNSGFELS